MSTQIYNPEEIMNKAAAMNNQAGELQSLINQMAGVVESMGKAWVSPASSSFQARFNEIRPELDSFVKSINSFAERATAQARAVLTTEGPV